MVELGKAGCHLSASRSRRGNDNERAGCLDVLVLSVSLIAHDQWHIMRIARNRVVNVNRDAELLQSLFERVCAVLAGVLGDDNASDIEAASAELVDQTEHVAVIGDAEVTADLFFSISAAEIAITISAWSESCISMRSLASGAKPGRTRDAWKSSNSFRRIPDTACCQTG